MHTKQLSISLQQSPSGMDLLPARLVERFLQACTDLRQQLIVTEVFCSPWQLEGTEEEDEPSEADAQTSSVGLSALDSSLQASLRGVLDQGILYVV